MEITAEIFNKKFNELDPKLQGVLTSEWYMARVFGIGTTYKLTEKQVKEMSDETTLILMSFTKRDELGSHLIQRLGIPLERAEQLKKEIETLILDKTNEAELAEESSDVHMQAYTNGVYEIKETELSLIDNKLGPPEEKLLIQNPSSASQLLIQKYTGGSDPYREAL